jgi:cyclohexyl-isocyanide hydratase
MITIGMILFDGMTQLDLTGPLEVFTRLPGTVVHLIAKEIQPVKCDRGLTIMPDTSFKDCPEQLTVLFVPGGPGVSGLLKDSEYINFIRSKKDSTYITSVCTGSLVLAACGLLKGFKATTHWLSLDLLKRFNVALADERVVIDRNRITGGGVTSGIDFALTLASMLLGEEQAKEIQLMIEYNPHPPFNAGHPSSADDHLVKMVKQKRAKAQEKRLKEIESFLSDHSDLTNV